MHHESPGALELLYAVKHSAAGASAVDGHEAPPFIDAALEDVVKNVDLIVPLRAVFRASVQANFADIVGFRQQCVKQREFAFSLLRQLRVKPKRRADTLGIPGEGRCASPGGGGRCHREHVEAAVDALFHHV